MKATMRLFDWFEKRTNAVDHTVCDVLVEILNGVALDSNLKGFLKAYVIDAIKAICISGFSEEGIQNAIGEFARDSGVRRWVNEFLEKTGYDNARSIVGTGASKSRLEWERKVARPESHEDILIQVLCEKIAEGLLTRSKTRLLAKVSLRDHQLLLHQQELPGLVGMEQQRNEHIER
jgi:hypothetical protein